MGSFTPDQFARIVDSALDYHMKNPPKEQTVQNKPLLKAIKSKVRKFPGGKENITSAIVGAYTSGSLQGYSHDDTVTYRDVENDLRAKFKWYEAHTGMKVTETELKIDGISVSDSGETNEHAGRDATVLTNILTGKFRKWDEEYDRDMNAIFWGDGTADPLLPAGIQALVSATPSTGTVGSFDRATLTDGSKFIWRNRARVGSLPTIAATGQGPALTGGAATNQTVINFLDKELPQLRRYGGKPTEWFAGSDFIDQHKQELRAKGNYTLNSFGDKSSRDGSIGSTWHDGIEIKYDPTLDDLGFAKRLYILDLSEDGIEMQGMEGEVDKMRKPNRPIDQYVMYRAKTCTFALCAWSMLGMGVYEIT